MAANSTKYHLASLDEAEEDIEGKSPDPNKLDVPSMSHSASPSPHPNIPSPHPNGVNPFANRFEIVGLYRLGGIAYFLFICVTGLTLITVEPFKSCTYCENPLKIFIESFFIYLYVGSIASIILLFALMIIAKNKQKISIRNSNGQSRRLSATVQASMVQVDRFFNWNLPRSSKIPLEKAPISSDPPSQVHFNTDPASQSENGKLQCNSGTASVFGSTADISKYYFTYDYQNGTGELYMRVGTAIFSLFAMIDRCLSLIQMIEAYFYNHEQIRQCRVTFIVTMAAKMTSLVFIFMQSFFIFKYANILINYKKNIAAFALIHMICTNFCVTFRTIVNETFGEIRHHDLSHNPGKLASYRKIGSSVNLHHAIDYEDDGVTIGVTNSTSTLTRIKHLGCIFSASFNSSLAVSVAEVHDKLSPYLYPCIIEYGIIAMTVFFILCKSIRYTNSAKHGKGTNTASFKSKSTGDKCRYEKYHNAVSVYLNPHEDNSNINVCMHQHQEKRYVNQFTVDCGKSTTGLFFGIFVVLITIISLITYFIYKNNTSKVAVFISESTELFLMFLSMLVIMLTYFKVLKHKFYRKTVFELHYDGYLVFVGLLGIYLYALYSIIAILNQEKLESLEYLSLFIHILSMFEGTLASVFMIDLLNMYTPDERTKKAKPGRSLITLLILLNMSLWLSETFSIKKYDMNTIQLDYYQVEFWSLVSSISAPLAIFFRFHASVCISDIWKDLYE